MPVARLENGNWPHPARLPLGCGWSGYCSAPSHEGEVPAQAVLETFCNLGYASSCSWSPVQRTWDAVRFAVSAPEASSRDKGTVPPLLRLNYVCERENRPADHGELEFDPSQGTWQRQHEDARIQKMAECFLE